MSVRRSPSPRPRATPGSSSSKASVRASRAKASPRPRAPDETRAALVAAAARLFLRDGLDVPSLDAICEEAGKTRGAFYVHFKSREDLVAAVVELALTELLERIVRPDQDLGAIVRSFVAALSAGALPLTREVRFSQVLEASVRSSELRVRFLAMLLVAKGRIADAVSRSMKSGSVDPARDPDAIAEMLLALVLGVQAAAQLGAPYDASGVERELLAMLAPREAESPKPTRARRA
ncbi:MAG: TetR/AcrR family transcriptional regulator [Sandaracinaceae bacterium]|nr:TetR/AcrR family transcriptional regulator [Sandaracinaceae bacterium]